MFYFFVLLFLLSSCKEKQRYTRNSPEIETYKKVISDYVNRDWNDLSTHYADSAKIMNNVTENHAQNITDLITTDKEDANSFSSWDYINEKYEMVVNDENETWVYFNGIWKATLSANQKVYEIPARINVRFVNGKIVREEGFWDLSRLMFDMIGQQQQDSTLIN